MYDTEWVYSAEQLRAVSQDEDLPGYAADLKKQVADCTKQGKKYSGFARAQLHQQRLDRVLDEIRRRRRIAAQGPQAIIAELQARLLLKDQQAYRASQQVCPCDDDDD